MRRAGAVPRRVRPGPRPPPAHRGRPTSAGALAVVAADLLALTLLESPGAMGADVVVGSSQRFGVPLFYGGPHAGFMSVASGLERHLPGRLVGRLRRRRGPSGLPAGAADPRAAHPPRQGDLQHLHRPGAAGRRRLDVRRLPRPRRPAGDRDPHPPLRRRPGRGAARGRPPGRARAASSTPSPCPVPGRAAAVVAAARELGLHLRLVDADTVGVSTSETTTPSTPGPGPPGVPSARRPTATRSRRSTGSPATRCRPSCVREHGVPDPRGVLAHHSETQMLRYLRRLSARDYALDRGMIPLGSCTMKLNATTEMEPVSLPGFADLHPFAPAEDAEGYRELVDAARGLAGRGHRLRPGLDPAQRRLAGRAGRAAGDPRLPPRERRHRPRRLPDPELGARHQRRVGGDGRDAGRGGQGRRRRVGRPRRPARPVREARRRPGRDHGHLPLDARRLRGLDHRAVPGRARARRPGLRRRRQPQRAARLRQARRVRRRRVAPQPAQDLLHPARWRRPGRRAGRGARPPRAVPALARAAPRGRQARGHRPDLGGAVRLGRASCRSRGPTCG